MEWRVFVPIVDGTRHTKRNNRTNLLYFHLLVTILLLSCMAKGGFGYTITRKPSIVRVSRMFLSSTNPTSNTNDEPSNPQSQLQSEQKDSISDWNIHVEKPRFQQKRSYAKNANYNNNAPSKPSSPQYLSDSLLSTLKAVTDNYIPPTDKVVDSIDDYFQDARNEQPFNNKNNFFLKDKSTIAPTNPFTAANPTTSTRNNNQYQKYNNGQRQYQPNSQMKASKTTDSNKNTIDRSPSSSSVRKYSPTSSNYNPLPEDIIKEEEKQLLFRRWMKSAAAHSFTGSSSSSSSGNSMSSRNTESVFTSTPASTTSNQNKGLESMTDNTESSGKQKNVFVAGSDKSLNPSSFSTSTAASALFPSSVLSSSLSSSLFSSFSDLIPSTIASGSSSSTTSKRAKTAALHLMTMNTTNNGNPTSTKSKAASYFQPELISTSNGNNKSPVVFVNSVIPLPPVTNLEVSSSSSFSSAATAQQSPPLQMQQRFVGHFLELEYDYLADNALNAIQILPFVKRDHKGFVYLQKWWKAMLKWQLLQTGELAEYIANFTTSASIQHHSSMMAAASSKDHKVYVYQHNQPADVVAINNNPHFPANSQYTTTVKSNGHPTNSNTNSNSNSNSNNKQQQQQPQPLFQLQLPPMPMELLSQLSQKYHARVIAIGDVHGCVEELIDLLRLVQLRPADVVVFLGDLVAKGPYSEHVISLAMDIGAVAVRGNHDEEVTRQFLNLYASNNNNKNNNHNNNADSNSSNNSNGNSNSNNSGSKSSSNNVHGEKSNTNSSMDADKNSVVEGVMVDDDDEDEVDAEEKEEDSATPRSMKTKSSAASYNSITTIASNNNANYNNNNNNNNHNNNNHHSGNNHQVHRQLAQSLSASALEWMSSLPYLIKSDDLGTLFVHAGIHPHKPPLQQERSVLLTIRSIDNKVATPKCIVNAPWAQEYHGPWTVYYGHDAVRGFQKYAHAVCTDSGCVYGGNLTAVIFPEENIVSVPARRKYLSQKRSIIKRGSSTTGTNSDTSNASAPAPTKNSNSNSNSSKNVAKKSNNSTSTTIIATSNDIDVDTTTISSSVAGTHHPSSRTHTNSDDD